MAVQSHVIVFGDLTCDSVAGLGPFIASKENTFLVTFFERVTFALRAEIGALPGSLRDNFVKFTDFSELVARVGKSSSPHPALEKALACTYQFACFIRYVLCRCCDRCVYLCMC
jgi:hypothetical protein